MIEGLLIDVKSAELKSILEERLEYHTAKAKLFTENAGKLRASIVDIEQDMHVGKVSNGNPADNMDQNAKNHEDKAKYFKFMIEHVIQDDTYRLDQEDLVRLGITVRSY